MILVNRSFTYLGMSLFLIFLSCANNKPNKTIFNGTTMGTTYSITLINFIDNKDEFKLLIDDDLERINMKFSTYLDKSEISILNNSTNDTLMVSNDFLYVLSKALYYCNLSNGSYDITVGPLVKLWGFSNLDTQYVPTNKDVNVALSKVGYHKISFNNNYLIKSDNVEIDLNSIAKGYAVDKIAELLENNNYHDYLIEIGGEIRTKVTNHKHDWIVGIQNPLSNTIIKKVKLNNMSMATSGTYNNFFKINNKIYSHIINPKTGHPFDYKTISSTIIAKDCIDADAYATIALTMHPDEIINLFETDISVEAYILEFDNDNIIEYKTSGFDKIETEN